MLYLNFYHHIIDDSMLEALRKAGLDKNESVVYVALLRRGTATAKPIIESTKLHRQLVYNSLDSLIRKGLVSYFLESNIKHFKACDPKQLLDYFEKRRRMLAKREKIFKEAIPQLEKIFNQERESQSAEIYHGNRGMKTILYDTLKENKEILIMGASDIKSEAFLYHSKYIFPNYYKIKEKREIRLKILFSVDMRNRSKEIDRLKYSESRILPKEFTSNSNMMIYGDKIAMIFWGSKPFGVIIQSRDIANSNRARFDLLWKIAKEPWPPK